MKIKNHDMQKSKNWLVRCSKNFLVAFRRVSRTSLTSLKRKKRADLFIFDFAYHDFLKNPYSENERDLRFIATMKIKNHDMQKSQNWNGGSF